MMQVHCLNQNQHQHQNASSGAWLLLEAEIKDAAGNTLGSVTTNSDTWYTYNADAIWEVGLFDTGSGNAFINENIDAREHRKVSGWKLPDFDPRQSAGSWERAAKVDVHPDAMPVAKTTLPLTVHTGVLPTVALQLSESRYFFDFGQERTGALMLTVPAATVAAWGGTGTELVFRLGEQVGSIDKHAVLFPDVSNWNKIPKWQSTFTLDGNGNDNVFEQHEYVGLWRYVEMHVIKPKRHHRRSSVASAAGQVLSPAAPFNLSQWTVHYPWVDEASFSSSNALLDSVWRLCKNTVKYTSLDTFTDSNVRERTPYEADGFLAAKSYWALRSERAFVAHSTQFVINNPTWPTEWKQYTVMLVHGHWMQTGDAMLADSNFDQLLNNTMLPFVDSATHLVNFTSSFIKDGMGPCPLGGAICNSPICHNDTAMFPPGVGSKSCDNIDWLPKFRAGFKFTTTNTIINAFAVRSMLLLAELANVTGRADWAKRLAQQAAQTKASMMQRMYDSSSRMWCDGICTSMRNHASFHSQHYLLSLGITPDTEVEHALAYLNRAGMVGSTYSANSLITGLFERGRGVDFGQTALNLLTSCANHSWCRMLQGNATTTWEHWEP